MVSARESDARVYNAVGCAPSPSSGLVCRLNLRVCNALRILPISRWPSKETGQHAHWSHECPAVDRQEAKGKGYPQVEPMSEA